MTRPAFPEGVLVAAVFAVTAAVSLHALDSIAGTAFAFRATAAGVSLAYVVYLLRASRLRVGNLTVVAGFVLLAAVAWWMPLSPGAFLAAHCSAIWLVRTLYFHGGFVAATADLVLVAFGMAALAWAYDRTGSVLPAVWCFFLTQALFTAIPDLSERRSNAAAGEDGMAFERAKRQADAAVRRLAG